ncbi:hypothetical protein HDE_11223 [Halotydeus destructor]|nr:hypothetical protein HDE_11223 [Halotydeus destructor]
MMSQVSMEDDTIEKDTAATISAIPSPPPERINASNHRFNEEVTACQDYVKQHECSVFQNLVRDALIYLKEGKDYQAEGKLKMAAAIGDTTDLVQRLLLRTRQNVLKSMNYQQKVIERFASACPSIREALKHAEAFTLEMKQREEFRIYSQGVDWMHDDFGDGMFHKNSKLRKNGEVKVKPLRAKKRKRGENNNFK